MDSQATYWLKIVLFGGAVLGAGIYLIVYIREQRELALKEKKDSLTGILKPEVNAIIEKAIPISVWFGSMRAGTNSLMLKNGYTFKPLEFSIGSDFELTVKLVKSKILLSCVVRSYDNKTVAKIVDNEWEVNDNNYFQRNYTDDKIEIVGQDGLTKLQVNFYDAGNIGISGSFLDSRKMYFVNADGTFSGVVIQPPNVPSHPAFLTLHDAQMESEKITNMFLYPSKDHFGELNPKWVNVKPAYIK